MGDLRNLKPPSFSFPPGCRFYPSEEQLICYYLTHKNTDDRRYDFDVINEIDLYKYDPFDLPEAACFRFGRGGRRRHWYCYAAARVLVDRGRRRAGGGFWKKRGRARDVMGGASGKVVVGKRKSFVFYLGDSLKNGRRTDWVMYEYALIDRDEASFVLCRVFVSSRGRHNGSEHILSSCGEESVATVRHIGIQHDGAVTSDKAVLKEEKTGDGKNEVSRYTMGLTCELDDRIGSRAAVLSSQQLASRTPHDDDEVRASGLGGVDSAFLESLPARHLIAILEEDFLELDDLACPLSCTDFDE